MIKLLKAILFILTFVSVFYLGMKYEFFYGNSAKQIRKTNEKQLIAKAQLLMDTYILKKSYSRGGTEAMRIYIDELQDQTVVTIWNLASSSSEETKEELKRFFLCALPVAGWQSTLPQSEDKAKLRKEAEAILDIVRKEHEEKVLLMKRKYAEQNMLKKPQRKAVLRSSVTNDTSTVTNAVVVP